MVTVASLEEMSRRELEEEMKTISNYYLSILDLCCHFEKRKRKKYLGECIKKERQKRQFTQKKLAEMLTEMDSSDRHKKIYHSWTVRGIENYPGPYSIIKLEWILNIIKEYKK